jgi:hypothetical protein
MRFQQGSTHASPASRMFKHRHCPRHLTLAHSQAPVSTSDATQPYNANAQTTHARPLHSQPSKSDVQMAPARRALWLASASLSPPALVAGCIGEVAKGGGFATAGPLSACGSSWEAVLGGWES